MSFLFTGEYDGGMGACIHTAFRKCLDSNLSCVGYHLISGCDEAWTAFNEALTRLIQDEVVKTTDPVSLAESLQTHIADGFNLPKPPKTLDCEQASLFKALFHLFRTMPQDEVAAAFSFCFEE